MRHSASAKFLRIFDDLKSRFGVEVRSYVALDRSKPDRRQAVDKVATFIDYCGGPRAEPHRGKPASIFETTSSSSSRSNERPHRRLLQLCGMILFPIALWHTLIEAGVS